MNFWSPKEAVQNFSKFDSMINKHTSFNGLVSYHGSFLVKGSITGDVQRAPAVGKGETPYILVIDEGCIIGNVEADFALIKGSVKGKVVCTKFLEINKNAVITGDIWYNEIRVHRGAVIEGLFHCISHQIPLPDAVVQSEA